MFSHICFVFVRLKANVTLLSDEKDELQYECDTLTKERDTLKEQNNNTTDLYNELLEKHTALEQKLSKAHLEKVTQIFPFCVISQKNLINFNCTIFLFLANW